MPGPAAGQRVNSLPGLFPSSVTAYDLEEGMPISCVKDGWVDQKGRLWVNACTSQPEHRTVNFFQFDGRRSEIIHLEGAPPEAEGQLAVKGIGDTGELYGFFRGSEHFFYFNPDTRSTRFFRLGQADAAIYFMEESPAYGLIIMAASGETQWIYRLAGESVEQLLEYPVAKACSEAVRYHDVQLQFQTITGEDVWFLPAPESYCTPTAIRKQFRLFRFSLRNHTLQEYTYDELFSEAPAPSAFVRNEFLLSSGHKGQLIVQEKLASLGQMSAGIAHEIKNPLNFINNFALGSKELLEEMNREFSNENMDNGALLRQNMSSYLEMLQKYNQNIFKHGSRIDEIIAGMMDHARAASEKRLASDLNKLVESNLKLASCLMGSRTVKVEPSPILLSTSILPSSNSTSSLVSARPMPRPQRFDLHCFRWKEGAFGPGKSVQTLSTRLPQEYLLLNPIRQFATALPPY